MNKRNQNDNVSIRRNKIELEINMNNCTHLTMEGILNLLIIREKNISFVIVMMPVMTSMNDVNSVGVK